MTKTEYREYLCSDHWKNLRKEMIEAEGRCERCHLPRWLAELIYDQDLHLHHLTYANLGDEQYEDLEVLCRRCHDVESNGRSELPLLKAQTCLVCRDKHWDKRSDYCAPCTWLLEGPNLFHILRVKHPTIDETMAQFLMRDIALSCCFDDECVELIEFIRRFVFDFKASRAGRDEIPF